MSDKLQFVADMRQANEALNTVRLKIALAPLPLGGAGGGLSCGREKNQITAARAFSPRELFLMGIARGYAPLCKPDMVYVSNRGHRLHF
jgi:hypothetical protein